MTGKIDKPTSQGEAPAGEAQTRDKKFYAKPRLSVHGNVEQITKGGDSGLQEEDLTGTSIGGGL